MKPNICLCQVNWIFMPCKCPSWARICPLSGAISQQRHEGGVQHPKNGTFTDPGFSIASLGLNFFRSFEHRSPHETYHVDPRGPTWTHVADVAIMLGDPGDPGPPICDLTTAVAAGFWWFCGTLFFSFWGDFEHHLHIEGICWDTMMPPVAWLMLKWDI